MLRYTYIACPVSLYHINWQKGAAFLYDMIWYDMIWYDMIWYGMIYDTWYYMIYLTAIGLTPCGSSTHLHANNTQNNTIDTKQYIERYIRLIFECHAVITEWWSGRDVERSNCHSWTHYPGIWKEELMGTTKIQIQDIRCAIRRFQTRPPGWQHLVSWRSYQTRIGLC